MIRWLQRIGAVGLGFVTVALLSVGADMGLTAAGVFPRSSDPSAFTTPLLLLATAYRTAFGVIGGYVAARLAPDHPMAHAIALGIVGLMVGAIGAIVMWDVGQHWYPLTLAVLAPPAAWLGGRFHRGAGA